MSKVEKIPKIKIDVQDIEEQDRNKGPSKGMIQLISGSLSGLVTCLMFQPFDLLKTRLQQDYKKPIGSIKDSVPNMRTGLVGQVQRVIAQDGFIGLWRGTTPTILRNVPGMGMYFLAFEKLKVGVSKSKSLIPNSNQSQANLTRTDTLLCGALARTLVGFVLMPITIVKVRVESDLYPTIKTTTQGFSSVIKTSGFKGLFAGFGATAIRDAPYAGLYVFFYELNKSLLGIDSLNLKPNPYVNMLSGLGAGFTATILTHPFDVLKTRTQLDPKTYPTLIQGIKVILRSENVISTLYKGLLMRTLRKSLSSAISWTCYEQFVDIAKKIY